MGMKQKKIQMVDLFELTILDFFSLCPCENQSIQYGYIIEATMSYYPKRYGWKLWYGINGLFYYKSTQD